MYKLFLRFSLIAFLGSVLLFNACSDVPGSLGEDLVSSQDVDAMVLLDSASTKDTSVVSHPLLGSVSPFLLGKNSEVEAVAMIRFVPTISSIKDRLLAGKIVIDTALITLTRNYILGAETDRFDYTAHEILNSWVSTDIRVDSLSLIQTSGANVITQKVGDDTVTSKFHLDKSITEKWLKVAVDTFLTKNYGFMLKPTSDTRKIVGYEGITTTYANPPLLYIVYHDVDSSSIRRNATFSADADVHTVRLLDSNKYAAEKLIVLQNGVIRDARISFDYNVLPKDAVLHSCSLILTKDTNSVYNFTGSPNYLSTVYAYYLSDSAAMTVNTSYATSFSVNGNEYTADITNIVSAFAIERKNINIGLFSASRFLGADGIAFFSSKQTDKAKRPRLKLVYSQRSN